MDVGCNNVVFDGESSWVMECYVFVDCGDSVFDWVGDGFFGCWVNGFVNSFNGVVGG